MGAERPCIVPYRVRPVASSLPHAPHVVPRAHSHWSWHQLPWLLHPHPPRGEESPYVPADSTCYLSRVQFLGKPFTLFSHRNVRRSISRSYSFPWLQSAISTAEGAPRVKEALEPWWITGLCTRIASSSLLGSPQSVSLSTSPPNYNNLQQEFFEYSGSAGDVHDSQFLAAYPHNHLRPLCGPRICGTARQSAS